MKMQKRSTDVKRHTIGYKIGNRWFTRGQAVKLAQQGKIEGVVACNGKDGRYIQSLPSHPNLYDLPIVVDA